MVLLFLGSYVVFDPQILETLSLDFKCYETRMVEEEGNRIASLGSFHDRD